ncbi:hypothetical protein [Halovenus sp. HT40]|uniref:hypothetical protein n=1 Tax=Halovenus sp. HT40 TaxID=3126691 RepID=UPI00300F618E
MDRLRPNRRELLLAVSAGCVGLAGCGQRSDSEEIQYEYGAAYGAQYSSDE